jgi:drug/metabolite transporter (DMT)-like permease
MNKSCSNKIILSFSAIYVIWGTTYLGIRYAVETIPPMLMAGTRFVLAGGILYLISRFGGREKPTIKQWRSASIIGAFLILIGHGAVVIASKTVPSSLVALLVSTVPIWMVLIDWTRRHGPAPSWKVIFGLILGFMGMAFLIGPGKIVTEAGGDVVGIVLAMLAPIFWSIGSLYSRTANLPDSSLLGTSMQMISGGVMALTAAVVLGEFNGFDITEVSLHSTLAFFYLVIFGSWIAFSSYIWLLKNTTAARISTYTYVNTVIALFVGWIIGREYLSPRAIFAAAIIIVSVVIIVSSRTGRNNSSS